MLTCRNSHYLYVNLQTIIIIALLIAIACNKFRFFHIYNIILFLDEIVSDVFLMPRKYLETIFTVKLNIVNYVLWKTEHMFMKYYRLNLLNTLSWYPSFNIHFNIYWFLQFPCHSMSIACRCCIVFCLIQEKGAENKKLEQKIQQLEKNIRDMDSRYEFVFLQRPRSMISSLMFLWFFMSHKMC